MCGDLVAAGPMTVVSLNPMARPYLELLDGIGVEAGSTWLRPARFTWKAIVECVGSRSDVKRPATAAITPSERGPGRVTDGAWINASVGKTARASVGEQGR